MSFVAPDDTIVWRQICRLAGLEVEKDHGQARKTRPFAARQRNFRSRSTPMGEQRSAGSDFHNHRRPSVVKKASSSRFWQKRDDSR